MGKISINDIAKSLGVSKTLVSFVINGRGNEKGIKKDTQKMVMDKVAELGYQPNAFARSLRTGKSKTIGVIVADISNPFYARMCRSIEDELSKFSYNVVICSSDEKEEKENKLIDMLVDRQVDGIIISPTSQKPLKIKSLIDRDFPVILIDRFYSQYKIPYVSLDNFDISKKAVEYLFDKGHKNIGLLSISPGYTSVMKERIEGYKAAVRDKNGRVDNSLIFEINFEKINEQLCEVMTELVKKKNITAVFSLNNSISKEVLKCAKRFNREIPEDISLISFDDIELFEIVNPSVTAIKQPICEMGKKASNEIINVILKKHKPDNSFNKKFKAEFVERNSVKEL